MSIIFTIAKKRSKNVFIGRLIEILLVAATFGGVILSLYANSVAQLLACAAIISIGIVSMVFLKKIDKVRRVIHS